jgi:hypothetical protein
VLQNKWQLLAISRSYVDELDAALHGPGAISGTKVGGIVSALMIVEIEGLLRVNLGICDMGLNVRRNTKQS